MILVLGGGFGVYGHLPALLANGHRVAAPARYRSVAAARMELAAAIEQVEWVEDEREAASRATLLVLVRRPADNAALAHWACSGGSAARLVIEKPIAPDWRQAAALEAALVEAGRDWAVPYLFLHCAWFAPVAAAVNAGRSVRIDWSHRQSSGVRKWKKTPAEGGGAGAFYFIHALALLEALRPGCVPAFVQSRNGAEERIEAQLDTLAIVLELGTASGFRIAIDDATIVDDPSPFGAMPVPGATDPRIPVLQRFYARLDGPGGPGAEFYCAVTRHWRALSERQRD